MSIIQFRSDRKSGDNKWHNHNMLKFLPAVYYRDIGLNIRSISSSFSCGYILNQIPNATSNTFLDNSKPTECRLIPVKPWLDKCIRHSIFEFDWYAWFHAHALALCLMARPFEKVTKRRQKITSSWDYLWFLSHRRPAKAQASLRIRAVLLEPLLFAHMKHGSRRRGPSKYQTSSPTGWLRMRVWRMSLRRTKIAIISWDGSNVCSLKYQILSSELVE